jgi:chromosome segregation ATPase
MNSKEMRRKASKCLELGATAGNEMWHALADLTDRVNLLWGNYESLDANHDSTEQAVSKLEDEVAALREHLNELQAQVDNPDWRERR